MWHASRAIFQDIWTGVTFESQAKQEYGRNEKLGDKTSSTKQLFEAQFWPKPNRSFSPKTHCFRPKLLTRVRIKRLVITPEG